MSNQSDAVSGESKNKPKFQFPHVFIILFGIIIIVSILSYIIPSGEFDREEVDGTTTVVEGTYHAVQADLPGIFDIFLAIPSGMLEGGSIIFFILIVGGSFGIVLSTNAVEAFIAKMTNVMGNKEIYLIPVLMLFFALGGATFGMAEEIIPFMLISVPLAIRIGYDSLVGAAIVIVGAYSGFTAAFINPFTVGVAQTIAELPLFSGMFVRIVFWFVFVGISIAYVMFYAIKIKKNPQKSIMYKEDKDRDHEPSKEQEVMFTVRHGLIIATLVLTLVGLALGVIFLDWYVNEIAALFVIMGVIAGIIAKMSPNQIAESFIKGCETLVVGALVVGLAYGILVILEDSKTIDTILNFASTLVGNLPGYLSAMGMYITQSALNFIVPSGSGQAALTMPIMTPLSDLVGVSRQTAVLAFQMGDGISNIVTPTSGVFMAALAIARVSWIKWMKWVWPLILIHYLLGAIFVTVAHVFIW